MESISYYLIFSFIIVYIVEFYFFGMQRAVLLISRYNDVDYRSIGSHLLPKWYSVVWIVKILKYLILFAILFSSGWKLMILLFIGGYIISSILPIPYKLLYRKIFRNRIDVIRKTSISDWYLFNKMLDAVDY